MDAEQRARLIERGQIIRYYQAWQKRIDLLDDIEWLIAAGESTPRIIQRLGMRRWESLRDRLTEITPEGTQRELGERAVRIKAKLLEMRRNEREEWENWTRTRVRETV